MEMGAISSKGGGSLFLRLGMLHAPPQDSHNSIYQVSDFLFPFCTDFIQMLIEYLLNSTGLSLRVLPVRISLKNLLHGRSHTVTILGPYALLLQDPRDGKTFSREAALDRFFFGFVDLADFLLQLGKGFLS